MPAPVKERIYDHEWFRPQDRLPERAQRVVWTRRRADGCMVEVRGTFAGGAVWLPEGGGGMYIYYTPIMWRVA